ncbi:unnamed protein product, partial [Amoebophrya sp. A25]|eukprot:GSA25T00002800001.1
MKWLTLISLVVGGPFCAWKFRSLTLLGVEEESKVNLAVIRNDVLPGTRSSLRPVHVVDSHSRRSSSPMADRKTSTLPLVDSVGEAVDAEATQRRGIYPRTAAHEAASSHLGAGPLTFFFNNPAHQHDQPHKNNQEERDEVLPTSSMKPASPAGTVMVEGLRQGAEQQTPTTTLPLPLSLTTIPPPGAMKSSTTTGAAFRRLSRVTDCSSRADSSESFVRAASVMSTGFSRPPPELPEGSVAAAEAQNEEAREKLREKLLGCWPLRYKNDFILSWPEAQSFWWRHEFGAQWEEAASVWEKISVLWKYVSSGGVD